MEDYEAMVNESRPQTATIIVEAHAMYSTVVRKIEKSWKGLNAELQLVEDGTHPVLEAMRKAHQQILKKVQRRLGDRVLEVEAAYGGALACIQDELIKTHRDVVTRERSILDNVIAVGKELIDWAVDKYRRVPVLNAAAVYEDVCEYLMVLADLRLTLCTMVGSAIHDVLVAGASPREAIEKARDATQDERDELPDSLLQLYRLLRNPLGIKNKELAFDVEGGIVSAQKPAKKSKPKKKHSKKKAPTRSKSAGKLKRAGGDTDAKHKHAASTSRKHKARGRLAALDTQQDGLGVSLQASMQSLHSRRGSEASSVGSGQSRSSRAKASARRKRGQDVGAVATPKDKASKYWELPFSPIVTVKGMPTKIGRTKTPYIKGRGEAIVSRASKGFFKLPPAVGRSSGPGTFAGTARSKSADNSRGLFLPSTPGKMRTKAITWDDTQKQRQKQRLAKAREEREERQRLKAAAAAPTTGGTPGSDVDASEARALAEAR